MMASMRWTILAESQPVCAWMYFWRKTVTTTRLGMLHLVRRPGKGNDKGNVEKLVGYTRRNFMVSLPRAACWEALNTQLLEQCRKRRGRRLWGHEETITQRFERDREKLLPLPAAPYEAC